MKKGERGFFTDIHLLARWSVKKSKIGFFGASFCTPNGAAHFWKLVGMG
jgi:hypothetical protein